MKSKTWPPIRKTNNHGKTAFVVDTRHNGTGERRFFSNRREAEGFALLARVRRENEGRTAFDDKELAEHGWTVQQAIRFALDHLRRQASSVTIPEAVEALISQKAAAGKSKRYQNDLRLRLSRLSESMPGRKIRDITANDLDAFLTGLNVAPGTQNTFRRDIRTLWSYADKRGWADASVAKRTDRVQSVATPPEIFTPDEAARLLAASSGDVLAFNAIGLFAGLRVAEISRLDWRDVDLAGGFVHVSAKTSKTRSRRLVPVLPSLRAWLELVTDRQGPVVRPGFRKRHEAARTAAKLTKWPANGLRHSFVSYRLADTGDAAKTAMEAGHDQGVLFAHYRELVRPKEAAAYFEIRP